MDIAKHLTFCGMVSDSRVNNGEPLPLFESKERADGKPSINTQEGWNAFCEEHEKRMIGKRLTAARERSGYTVSQVAAACGITAKAVNDYECGTRIPRDSVKNALAELYRVTVPRLFF